MPVSRRRSQKLQRAPTRGLLQRDRRPDASPPERRGEEPTTATPLKALGQHFLKDASVIERIVVALEPGADEVVIEVGAGTGALTGRLLRACGRLIAVEIDRRLCSLLESRYGQEPGFTLIAADVLEVAPPELLRRAGVAAGTPYLVAGNLPYNAGAAILRHFLEAEQRPRRLVVMLQREVAETITAAPGRMGILSIAVQTFARPKRLFNVPPGAFLPPPKVTSSVLRLDVLERPRVASEEREEFFLVVRAGFSAPRKQLRNSLANGLGMPAGRVEQALEGAGIDPRLRPQALDVEDWLRLSRALRGNDGA